MKHHLWVSTRRASGDWRSLWGGTSRPLDTQEKDGNREVKVIGKGSHDVTSLPSDKVSRFCSVSCKHQGLWQQEKATSENYKFSYVKK